MSNVTPTLFTICRHTTWQQRSWLLQVLHLSCLQLCAPPILAIRCTFSMIPILASCIPNLHLNDACVHISTAAFSRSATYTLASAKQPQRSATGKAGRLPAGPAVATTRWGETISKPARLTPANTPESLLKALFGPCLSFNSLSTQTTELACSGYLERCISW